MKKYLKSIMPNWMVSILGRVYGLALPYQNYDNANYWKARAQDQGQGAVLWKNLEYNELYRKLQKEIIRNYVSDLAPNSKVLDIGAGIGVVSEMIKDINPEVSIDLVDFSEMMSVAKAFVGKKLGSGVNFISSSAEIYSSTKPYDLIISSGCYSAIRDQEKFWNAISNINKMTSKGSVVLMIDPFHKVKLLARVRVSGHEVTEEMKSMGFELIEKSGVLFWPYREMLANSTRSGENLAMKFKQGEWLLNKLGRYFWADYKILAYKKTV